MFPENTTPLPVKKKTIYGRNTVIHFMSAGVAEA